MRGIGEIQPWIEHLSRMSVRHRICLYRSSRTDSYTTNTVKEHVWFFLHGCYKHDGSHCEIFSNSKLCISVFAPSRTSVVQELKPHKSEIKKPLKYRPKAFKLEDEQQGSYTCIDLIYVFHLSILLFFRQLWFCGLHLIRKCGHSALCLSCHLPDIHFETTLIYLSIQSVISGSSVIKE